MKKIAVALALLLLAGNARADVIATNFGPNGSYSDLNVYAAGPEGPSGHQYLAVNFTPTANYTLGDVELPLFWTGGVNEMSLALVADSGGLPKGTTLVQETLTNALPGNSAAPFHWNPAAAVSLTAGQSYWITGVGSGNFEGGWNENNQGQNGFAIVGFGNDWVNSGFTTPAFRVNGSPAPTVIESNLGPGDSFDAVNGWPVIGEDSGFTPQSLAVPITPDADFTLTKIEAALNGEGSASNGVTFSLVADNGGLPTGETLLRETLTGVLSDTPAIVTWNPSQRITLDGGGIYWLVAQGVNNSFISWQYNDRGAAGFAHAFGDSWATDLRTTPAYRATGILAAAAPEPSSLAYLSLFGIALISPPIPFRRRADATKKPLPDAGAFGILAGGSVMGLIARKRKI